MSTISRRAFLKTVGVGALSVAAVSVLAGCDKLPTGNTEVVTGTIEGTKGNVYKVSNTLFVSASSTDAAVPTTWMDAYKAEYVKVVNAGSDLSTFPASENTYDNASDALKAEAAAEAKAKADYVKTETATFAVVVNNYGSEDIILGESGDSKGYKSSSITVSGGEDVTFLITTNRNVLKAGANTVNITAKIPCNAESFVVTIALPGAEKAVKYTVKNSNYVKEIDPKKFSGYSVGTKV